ncbi:methyltransferase family protein [Kitasatospora sp. SolWspMP-SS2h]|uniref:methyltransferase domain-containing protein n=1 Tax=Kitasatospora sp. SolWspMP-SS2h TaxID=1305729 RepID=UPI000DBA518C|nr:methyltransferase domain-containing protein [Kitasatospora sp. SolWspMP-SS2h]RAJ36136.1 methyltransferase family protein [Kitasatospora sp. SolWspMP-SS2h]
MTTTAAPQPTAAPKPSVAVPGESSYTADVHPDLDFELDRLRNQALLVWSKEVRLLRSLGLRPDTDLLEVGSGPGFVTGQLLREVPQGTVTALELDADLLERSRHNLRGADTSRLTLVPGSILDSGLPGDSADLALVRMVLQHLPQPEAALAELHRLVRPGGRVVVTDVDDHVWGVLDPALPKLQPILDRRNELQAVRGGNRLIGRRLGRLLKAAGFTDITVDAIAVSSDELGLDALLPQIDIAPRLALLLQEGIVTEQEMAELLAEREEFLAHPDPAVLLTMFVVSGRKQG